MKRHKKRKHRLARDKGKSISSFSSSSDYVPVPSALSSVSDMISEIISLLPFAPFLPGDLTTLSCALGELGERQLRLV